MALVTLQRSPTPSASSTASTVEVDAGSSDDHLGNQSFSESFFMVKGAALFLQQGSGPQGQRTYQQCHHHHHKHAGDLPQHLQVMINLLRSEDRIKLAVRLESILPDRVRYMVVVYSVGRQDTEENILLGIDFTNKESKSCTIGMVLPLWSDTKIHLDGDGGFSMSTAARIHIFKPVSVQAMWSALQVLHKACEVSRRYNYYTSGMALSWATYYESCISSDQSCINEWNAMQDLESTRSSSPALYVDKPSERECTESLITAKLRSIMMSKDLENVTSKDIRNELEKEMNCDLREYKEFIDNKMFVILGQMDKATLIFEHVYLGSEWNASNLEELQDTGVGYILNVTREIDNFFPGMFAYHNIRVYDEETTDLLGHWNEAYNFINKAKKNQSKCLVHCKMGISRSASTVIAYAMKEFGWSLEKAYNYVKEKRNVTQPNKSFMRQLAEYEGILDASKQRHNKLWKQQPESNKAECTTDCAIQKTSKSHDLNRALENAHSKRCDKAEACHGRTASTDCDSLNLTYYFRRLPDNAVDSDQPCIVKQVAATFHVDDLERDALLENSLPSLQHFVVDSKTLNRQNTEISKEGVVSAVSAVKKKLQFGGAQVDSEHMCVPRSIPATKTEGILKSQQQWSSVFSPGHLNKHNVNNNNSKNSCSGDFEDGAMFALFSKVQPSYRSCAECICSPETQSCEFPVEPSQCHSDKPVCSSATVYTQPSGSIHVTAELSNQNLNTDKSDQHYRVGKEMQCSSNVYDQNDECRESLRSTDLLHKENNNCGFNFKSENETGEECMCDSIKNLREIKDLQCIGKGASQSYLIQHQESLIKLQKAGLVRKHTKELEKLSSKSATPVSNPGRNFEHVAGASQDGKNCAWCHLQSSLHIADLLPSSTSMGSLVLPANKMDPLTVSNGVHQKNLASHVYQKKSSRDVWEGTSLAPISLSMKSHLIRSSSSDSICCHCGKMGLVKQKSLEAKVREHFAGLTIPSRLKRSYSVAKLRSLNFCQDNLLLSDGSVFTSCSSDKAKINESLIQFSSEINWHKNKSNATSLRSPTENEKNVQCLGNS
ncbi:protein phosphatase Slingshot homolog 1 isoform X1 [Protopterus annectens]|uniref:protein phosphatase Slingshot homolog 1 isoform X1 n=1 Tax=Protopterus annectens TaxID=7888 RepID=UPI001CFAAE54|nr:protein phosphatase Slingshot homolog 1 isoform X1 [Protopterus annectens]